ncbi:HNH endonuclease [Streptomyces halstedii]|uniref:HNH endonuclease n=1 Tax=Streptomyces halstedii TaxID=1944 RepID=UPI0037FBCC73
MPPKPRPVADRLWEKVRKTEGCWEWTGSKNNHGYGRINVNRYPAYAHRVAYELVTGEDITGLNLLHSCDNPGCVKPEHLTPGTHKENMRDMVAKGRDNPWNRDKEYCEKGHLLATEPNSIDGRGNPCRRCTECTRLRSRKENKDPEAHERKMQLQRERRARLKEQNAG